MDKEECLAKLNLLGIYTISKFNVRGSYGHSFIVILFNTAHETGPIGYTHYKNPKVDSYETIPYYSYIELLNAAIKLSKETK